MNKNYADTLESYIIPANEGIIKDLWTSVTNTFKNRINRRKIDNNVSNTILVSNNTKAVENVRRIEEEIRNEYPELVEKEMKNRFQTLKKIRAAIIKFDKKYNIAGFSIDKYRLDELNSIIHSNSPLGFDNSEVYDDMCGFLEDLLPYVSEEDLRKKNKDPYYRFNYGWSNHWTLCIYSGDQWDWLESLPEDKKVSIRGDEYDYDLDLWSQFRNKIDERMMKEMNNIEFVFGVDDGGDNDSSIIGVILKPSKEILSIAKRRGYQWFE